MNQSNSFAKALPEVRFHKCSIRGHVIFIVDYDSSTDVPVVMEPQSLA